MNDCTRIDMERIVRAAEHAARVLRDCPDYALRFEAQRACVALHTLNLFTAPDEKRMELRKRIMEADCALLETL